MEIVGKLTGDIEKNAQLLRKLRKENSLSMEQLSRISELSIQCVYFIETTRRSPLIVSAAKMCDAMGYDILVVRRPSEE